MAILVKQVFYKHLNDNELIDNMTIDFEVILDQSVINWNYRAIKNITFKEKVIIKDVDINSGFLFANCIFEKGIVFQNIQSKLLDGSYNYSIAFENCDSASIIFERGCNLAKRVLISNKCKIRSISFSETIVVNGGINIYETIITYLHIVHSEFIFNLQRSTISKEVRIESLNGDIGLLANEFNKDIAFWNIECPFGFSSNQNIFKEEFNISGSRIKKLTLFGDHFYKKGELENRDLTGNNLETYIKEIYISETNFTQGFDFNGLGKKLDRLEIKSNPELKGVLKFEGWIVDSTLITGVNQNLKLLFKRMSFRFFMINDFTNYSDISFDKCKGYDDSTLNLLDCDLGSTRFNEFAFNSFVELRFDNVTLDKIKPTNNKWFEDAVLKIEVAEQSEEDRFKRKREIYRQLKQALKNNGNQIDSLFFQAREMESYRNELKQSKNYSLSDKIIMTFSRFNDYGLNWIKPVIIVFFLTLFVYVIILAGISDKILFSFSCDPYDIKNTFEVFMSNFKTFWNLFNPVRRTDLTYGKMIQTDWIYFIDLLHRIFLGIMIFQIIKAFRKHVSS
ncbi:hypothetical protein [Flavobacterium soyae]|uniref:Pentapeptide repeat-containing protein n=1 Tax=Flavobacterium soyae TaxID=2903098 RepID=A0ABZ2UB27_9FLAO